MELAHKDALDSLRTMLKGKLAEHLAPKEHKAPGDEKAHAPVAVSVSVEKAGTPEALADKASEHSDEVAEVSPEHSEQALEQHDRPAIHQEAFDHASKMLAALRPKRKK